MATTKRPEVEPSVCATAEDDDDDDDDDDEWHDDGHIGPRDESSHKDDRASGCSGRVLVLLEQATVATGRLFRA